MAVTLGPKGWIDLISTAEGPKRKVRILSVPNRATPGDALHPFANPDMQPIAAINVRDGKLVTTYISDTGTEQGQVKITDTGADVTRVGDTGDTLWVIYTDTGA